MQEVIRQLPSEAAEWLKAFPASFALRRVRQGDQQSRHRSQLDLRCSSPASLTRLHFHQHIEGNVWSRSPSCSTSRGSRDESSEEEVKNREDKGICSKNPDGGKQKDDSQREKAWQQHMLTSANWGFLKLCLMTERIRQGRVEVWSAQSDVIQNDLISENDGAVPSFGWPARFCTHLLFPACNRRRQQQKRQPMRQHPATPHTHTHTLGLGDMAYK